jgi:outer membrane protein OmpA-like peptidoglycan-associated protein
MRLNSLILGALLGLATVTGAAQDAPAPAQGSADPVQPAEEPRFFETAQDPGPAPAAPAPASTDDLPFPPAPAVPGSTPESSLAVTPEGTPARPAEPVPAPEPVVPPVTASTDPKPAPIEVPPPPVADTERAPAAEVAAPVMPEPEVVLPQPAADPATSAGPDAKAAGAMPAEILFSAPEAVPETAPAPSGGPPPDQTFSDPYLTSIYFGRGSADLTEYSQRKAGRFLRDLAKSLERYPSVVIELAGHADPFSEKGDVESLAQTRAQILRAYLISQGLSPERIRVSSKGSRDPRHTTGDTGRNRRVDILTYPR